MFDRVLIMSLDYLSCIAVVPRGRHRKINICQTYISSKLRIFPYSEVTHGSTIVRSLLSLFLKGKGVDGGLGRVNFDYLPRAGERNLKKWKKEVEVWCRERSLFLFNFFKLIISTFTNYFTLSKTVLCIWRKFISATITLWKKVILSCLKIAVLIFV